MIIILIVYALLIGLLIYITGGTKNTDYNDTKNPNKKTKTK